MAVLLGCLINREATRQKIKKMAETKQYNFGEEKGRTWLTCEYDGKQIKYAYPPVQGTHQYCFQTINAEPELVPAEDLGLALLVKGAFSRDSPEWKDVRKKAIIQRYTRIPKRTLWMPSTHEFEGVFVERDLQGKGFSTKMIAPESLDGWKKENGMYVSQDGNMVFAPRNSYDLGRQNKNGFSKDGVAIALMGTPESAEIFSQTAYDNKKTPWTWGLDTKKIKEPVQRVASLCSLRSFDGLRLLVCGYDLDVGRYGFAFGVSDLSLTLAK